MAAVFRKLSQFNDAFLKELEDDFQAPGSSKFQNYMNNCRTGMQKMEEVHVHTYVHSIHVFNPCTYSRC